MRWNGISPEFSRQDEVEEVVQQHHDQSVVMASQRRLVIHGDDKQAPDKVSLSVMDSVDSFKYRLMVDGQIVQLVKRAGGRGKASTTCGVRSTNLILRSFFTF